MVSRRAGQMDAAHAGQGVEHLRFEFPTLASGDGLRASVTRYPLGKQCTGHRLRRNVQQGMASCQCEMRSIAVRQYLKPSDVGSGPTMSTCRCWNRYVGRAKSPCGLVVCLDIFGRWQDWHARTQARQSFCTPDHTYG